MKRTKDNNDGSRRYPKDKFPVYHSTYDNKLSQSSVFKETGSALHGLGDCKGTLQQLVGIHGEGWYMDSSHNQKEALIPVAKKLYRRVLAKFKHWQKEQVRSGKALKPPKQWPNDLLQERLKAEALLDVRYKEKAKVEERIKQLEARRKKEHKKQMLPHGPLGRIAGGGKNLITQADGQRVSYSPDGIPYIDEPDSPYNGMTIVDYRAMSKQWKKDQGITLPQLREHRERLHQEAKKKAAKAGKEPPVKRLPVTHSKVPQWMDRLGITKSDWPDWPEGSEPINELEDVETV